MAKQGSTKKLVYGPNFGDQNIAAPAQFSIQDVRQSIAESRANMATLPAHDLLARLEKKLRALAR